MRDPYGLAAAPMLCVFCRREVLESEERWGLHQRRLSQFKKSAREGCVVCSRLAQDLGDLGTWFYGLGEPNDLAEAGKPADAIHRWTLRKTATLRESNEVVILTLRPNIDGDETAKNFVERARLPERTFFLIPEEDLGDVPEASDIGRTTNSEKAFAQVTQWLNRCIKDHPKCRKRHAAKDFVPARLIDVGSPQSAWPPQFFPLVETEEHHIHSPYATLSHCWGTKEPSFVELHDDNYERFTTEGVSWAEMQTNQNFVDAIQVARKINVRYIWIDSLCIIQRQKNWEDWNKQGDMMHQVYRNSHCNIASADSPNKEGGLFRTRTPQDIARILPAQYVPYKETKLFKRAKWRVIPSHIYEEQLMSMVLYSRGWVFQERLLSPRLIHFSRGQVFWDCATITACEALPSGLPLVIDANASTARQFRSRLQDAALSVRPIGDASLEEFWHSAVRTYTSCDLGFEGDKIKAMWGVAKLVRDALGEDFAEGMWTLNLAEQLCWRVVRGDGPDGHGKRTKDLEQFPSWTWASVQGAIEVGRRIPAAPLWWVATGADGGRIEFKLKERVFPRAGTGHESWRDEIVFMDKEIARVEARGMEIAAKLRRERDALITSAGASTGTTKRSGRRDALDTRPLLETTTIEIRGHVMQGMLTKGTDGQGWVVTGPAAGGLEKQLDAIQAFPDTAPDGGETECEFVFLFASRQIYGDWSDAGQDDAEYEEEELEQAKYQGMGILLRRIDGGRFQRAGAISFEDLPHAIWDGLLKTCCQDTRDTSSEVAHPLEEGQKLCLC
ncbi:HET-domain-containing protein [Thozetella sp. PMI_491]|nr:HET-domain-containing protein [Thozetella sp. PMI_491]